MEMKTLGMIWVMGFLTGLHCISMCGGLMAGYVRYSIRNHISLTRSHLTYSITKTASYALMGAIFGALGSLVSFNNGSKSTIAIIGGIFLLYLGAKSFGLCNKLKIFQWVSKKLPTTHLEKPQYIGLLNGLMISCGPLQALYLIAATKGDPIYGAIALTVFSLGTLPIFLCYGVLLNFFKALKSVWSDRVIALLIVIYGVVMIQQGISLGGYHLMPLQPTENNDYAVATIPKQMMSTYSMKADTKGWSKKKIYFTPTEKIRWQIEVTELTPCNKIIEIPALKLRKELSEGLNIIEFYPKEHTRLTYTCWMGMLTGEFVLKPL
ncbi:sulfite exporter TauE/SafE [Aquimarina brevivitae]|uniref:Sulfite exporter TauE/SafE n=2 Tax=Aquimarina brevivitae TaxID=323412 RepID=A0A4Q7NUD1_9FLAO|nr:sulfite exporter TauE/SafE [Aquimarina brevivitae]